MDEQPRGASGEEQEVVELELNFATMRQLQSELAPTLSSDGMFVAAEEPLPVDAVVRFRITLPEGFVLIEGTGVVIWTRAGADEGVSGMAIRYATLTTEAQETIDAIIDSHLASGGDLFSLEPGAGVSSTFPTDALGEGDAAERKVWPPKPGSTHEELERARLTIRGEPQLVSPESVGSLVDDLAAANGRVEPPATGLAVAGGLQQPEPPGAASDWDLPPLESPSDFDQLFEDVDTSDPSRGDVPIPDVPVGAPERGGETAAAAPIVDEEDETVEVLEVDPYAAAEELAAARAGESGPAEAGAPASAPDDTPIAAFLGVSQDETAGADPVYPGRSRDGAYRAGRGPTPSWRLKEGAAGEDAGRAGSPAGGEDVRWSATMAGGQAAADHGLAGMTELEEPEIGTDASSARRAAPARRRLLRWLLPVVGVVAVGGALYLERDRVRELVSPRAEGGPGPAAVTEETVHAPTVAPPVSVTAPETRSEAVAGDREPAAGVPPSQPVAEEAASQEEPAPGVPVIEEAAPAPVALAPATAVEDITFQPLGATTVVVLKANGAVAPDAVSAFPMRDPARILVRVRGIQEGYPRYELAVGTPQVERIRIGHHPEQRPPALYVVLDLADSMVGVTDLAVDGDTVRVAVGVE